MYASFLGGASVSPPASSELILFPAFLFRINFSFLLLETLQELSILDL